MPSDTGHNAICGSNNALSPVRYQGIMWTKTDSLLIELLETIS